MKGIRFDDLHSYDDMELILISKEIGSPAVKEYKVDIPGADSVLDYTDFFGEPKYDNVKHTFEFASEQHQSEFLTQFSTIKNAIHGKKKRIILDDDPLFFWVGRCYVSSLTSSRGVGHVVVECDCEPYKYKTTKTVMQIDVNGTFGTSIPNSKKRAVPEVKIQAEGTIRIVYRGNNTWDLGSGSYTLPELELLEGDNPVTVTGKGTITLTWQEGAL